MLDIVLYFLFGLAIVGIPAYVFYRLGLSVGVDKGIRRQLIREMMANGILEEASPSIYGRRA